MFLRARCRFVRAGWFDAARVSNWLQAGGGTYLTTTSGSAAINSDAYTLNGVTSGNAPGVNNGATFYVPTQDQWYKAAFYKGGGTNAGYWYYATQSDTNPTAVTAGTTGIGSAGNTGNFVNYSNGADWNSLDGNVTTVGTNGGPSAYGAFDVSGNLYEWNDLDGTTGSNRVNKVPATKSGQDANFSIFGGWHLFPFPARRFFVSVPRR
jgi:formylglycine-generating enzyme